MKVIKGGGYCPSTPSLNLVPPLRILSISITANCRTIVIIYVCITIILAIAGILEVNTNI